MTKKELMQSVFNKVWQHFIVEGNPRSYEAPGNTCAYRGANGAKCAVGVLIPDGEYSREIERYSFNSLVEEGRLTPTLRMYVEAGLRGFLAVLQEWHDDPLDGPSPENVTVEMDKEFLRKIAADYNLEVPS